MKLDMYSGIPACWGLREHIWTENLPKRPTRTRVVRRRIINIPARLTWKDQSGATRFASVVTRNVSDVGVYVECPTPLSIPLYRLVQFQIERDVRNADALPGPLQQGRVLSAVYRVSPPEASKPQGLALRLMVAPSHAVADAEQARATA